MEPHLVTVCRNLRLKHVTVTPIKCVMKNGLYLVLSLLNNIAYHEGLDCELKIGNNSVTVMFLSRNVLFYKQAEFTSNNHLQIYKLNIGLGVWKSK